jgi:DNA ligase-associated metallophosphoesterase
VSEGTLERELRGERLLLHPQRALSWPARRMLVVADTHFGKSSVFASHGIAVPGGADAVDRQRIDGLLRETGATRLLVLGDFLHGPLAADSAIARELTGWIRSLQPVQLWLVTGNHDRSAARGWQAAVAWQGGLLREGPFCFTHEVEESAPAGTPFQIGGHVHPVVSLGAPRKRRPRIPVFWERADSLVLPSFGLFTGGHRLARRDGGTVFAVATEAVVELPWT